MVVWYSLIYINDTDRDISSQTIASNLFRQAMVDIIKLPAPSNYRGGNSLTGDSYMRTILSQTSRGLCTWLCLQKLNQNCNRDICSIDLLRRTNDTIKRVLVHWLFLTILSHQIIYFKSLKMSVKLTWRPFN